MTLYTVYHFPQYMQRRTVAVFFNRSDAESFAIHHGHEYASNGSTLAPSLGKQQPGLLSELFLPSRRSGRF